jgi:hypothetical protein
MNWNKIYATECPLLADQRRSRIDPTLPLSQANGRPSEPLLAVRRLTTPISLAEA